MVTSERQMVRRLDVEEVAPEKTEERSTSLQPTYEDTITPDPDDWELDD